MLIRVLGSGGDGGVPRWDCGCANCAEVRAHRAARRTHASLALSADGESWLLIGATPDVLRQLQSFDGVHPKEGGAPPLVAIALRTASAAEAGGLRALQSRYPLAIYGGNAVRDAVSHAAPENAVLHDLPPGEAVPIKNGAGVEIGLSLARVDAGANAIAFVVSEPALGRVVVIAPDLPDGARLPPEAVAAAGVFVDASAAPRLPPNPPANHYLYGVAHDHILLDRAAPAPPWPLANDGLDLFV
jgi:hypothetical protein